MKEELKKLEKILKVKIKDPILWEEALTHKSFFYYHHEEKGRHNERLEFLGDAVLELCISLILYKKFYEKEEGELTLIRASLVNRPRLAEIAKALGLQPLIRMGKNIKGKGLDTVLGNTLEAIIGAYFIENGFLKTLKFIEKNFLKGLDVIIKEGLYKDPKSRLQEILQEKFGVVPEYKVLEESGPPHERIYKIGIYINGKFITNGEGRSKQEAETNAAFKVLENKLWKNL